MKKPLILPKFKDEDDERDFWDKIDLSDYYEPSDLKPVNFPGLQFTKHTNQTLAISLPKVLIQKVKKKAASLSMPYDLLIQQYIQRGMSGIK